MTTGGPHLLAVDDPFVTVEDRRGLEEARSEPEFGSLKPWHQRIVPFRICGRNSFFCSSVPHCRMVGPTSVSPKKSARSGALARANSSDEHDALHGGETLAAVLLGPCRTDPAALEQLRRPLLVELLALLGAHLETLVGPALRQVRLQPGPDLGTELFGVGGVAQIHASSIDPRVKSWGPSAAEGSAGDEASEHEEEHGRASEPPAATFTRRKQFGDDAEIRPPYVALAIRAAMAPLDT